MAKSFRELEAEMSPGSRARSDAKTQKMIEEMALNELRQAMRITQERLARCCASIKPARPRSKAAPTSL